MRNVAKPILLLAVAGLVGAAFAGCLNSTPKTSGETSISRMYSMDLDPKSMQKASESSTPGEAFRQLIHTDLVVRVAEPGAYTLEYTDAGGIARTESLASLVPGTPKLVSGADPLAPATLKAVTGDVKAVRGVLNATWWQAGELPLGFTLAPGAKAAYTMSSLAHEAITVTGVKAQNLSIDTATFALNLPVDGTVSYTLGAAEADGTTPLLVTGSYNIPAASASLVSFEAVGSLDGKPGHAGADLSAATGEATGAFTLWWKDGQPVAARPEAGHATFQPKITAWVDGGFVPEGQEDPANCVGKTKADNCQPSELKGASNTWEAGAKETINSSDLPRATSDQDRDAMAFAKALFAQDMQVGDGLRVAIHANSADMGATTDSYTYLQEITLNVVDSESVTVPAGTFDALKVVQSLRIQTVVDKLSRTTYEPSSTSSCTYDGSDPYATPCAPSPYEPVQKTIVSGLDVNETVQRTTFWFDSKTYQPVKMSAELPLDVQKLMDKLLRGIDTQALYGEQSGFPKITPDQVKISATGTSTFQATQLAPAGTMYSPVFALGFAQALAMSSAYAPGAFAAAYASSWNPFGSGMSHAEPVGAPTYDYPAPTPAPTSAYPTPTSEPYTPTYG